MKPNYMNLIAISGTTIAMALLASVVANSLPEPMPFAQAPAVVQIDRQGRVITPATGTTVHAPTTPAPPKAGSNSTPKPEQDSTFYSGPDPASRIAETAEPLNRARYGPDAYAALIPPRPHIAFLRRVPADQMTEIAVFQAEQQTEYAVEHTALAVEQSTGLGAQQSAGQSKGPAGDSCGFGSLGGTPHP